MNKAVEYIFRFLIGDTCTPEILASIGYTSPDDNNQYKLIIKPSQFFENEYYGTVSSLPQLPLKTIDGIPFLYGESKIERRGDTLILYADLIASAYFFLTGYETFVRPEIRDQYGRFPGKESLAFHAGFLHRPIVDEYGQLLRHYLREIGIDVSEPVAKIQKIYLTHDIDIPYYYRTLKGLARGWLIDKQYSLALRAFLNKKRDPAYTYPWIIRQNRDLIQEIGADRCESLFFFKAMGGCQEDKPVYNLASKDIQHLFSLCRNNHIRIGLHTSFYAGLHPERIRKEKDLLKKASKSAITDNRHHYLTCREMQDLMHLVKAGITDDFTMAYADVAGFRLGTCRPVQWINVVDQSVYPLMLHPLTLMERTFDRDYMDLSYEEAINYAVGLVDEIERHAGDLVLLWHNTSISEASSYQRALYQLLIGNLKER